MGRKESSSFNFQGFVKPSKRQPKLKRYIAMYKRNLHKMCQCYFIEANWELLPKKKSSKNWRSKFHLVYAFEVIISYY